MFIVTGDFNQNKEYVDYTISLLLENDVEFKCFRRYKFFDIFNTCLLNKYPFYSLPKLPEKKTRMMLNISDRENKLNFYLNFLYNHSEIKETEEFNRFINEFNFVSFY